MDEAIEPHGGELLVAEHLDPFGKGQIGGDDRCPPLVSLREQIEEELAAGALKWHKGQFVHDQKRDLFVALLQADICKPSLDQQRF